MILAVGSISAHFVSIFDDPVFKFPALKTLMTKLVEFATIFYLKMFRVPSLDSDVSPGISNPNLFRKPPEN